MSYRGPAFSAISQKRAAILHRALPFSRDAGYASVTFKGGWHRRRFIIVGACATQERPEEPADRLVLTLTVPVTLDAAGLMEAMRSFGASVERRWRDAERGRFDLVISEGDGQRHMVHRYHHVALCGHKPKTWSNEDEVGPCASEVRICSKCITAAETKPAYRARWHPAAVAGREPA